MAVVPYRPAPNVQARQTPVRPEEVQTPVAAFGGAIGAALQHLGATTGDAGNEVFGRAIAMQDLYNQTQSSAATTDFMNQATKQIADFNSQQGANAGPDQLNQLQQNLEANRQQVRSSLANPMAQKMYDIDSRNFIGRMFISAAGHSAEQMRQWTDQTIQSQVGTIKNSFIADPQNDLGYDNGLVKMNSLIDQQGALHGWSQDTIDFQKKLNTSDAELKRIEGWARTNPVLAKQKTQDWTKDGSLTGEDAIKANDFANNRIRTVTMRNVASGLMDGSSGLLGQGQVPMDRLLYATRMNESSNKYDATGPTVQTGPFKGQHGLGAYMVMQGNLQPWLKEAGMAPMTEQAFLHDSAAQDQLAQFKLGQYLKQTGSANDAASMWHSGLPLSEAIAKGAHDQNMSTQAYVQRFNKFLGDMTPLQEKTVAAQNYAAKLAPDDPTIGQGAAYQVSIAQQRADTEAREQLRQNMNVINSAIYDLQGKGALTQDAIEASSPQAKTIIESMSGDQQLELHKVILKAEENDNTQTAQRTSNRVFWSGIAQNYPEKFMDTDLWKVDLTGDDRKILQQNQGKMKAGALADARVTAALNQVKREGLLDAAGISYTAEDHDDYDKFTGALREAMEDFQKTQGRAPTPKDIDAIGKSLLSTYTTRGFLGLGSGTSQPEFESGVPDTVAAKLKQSNPNYTDEQISRIYRQFLYNKFYANPKATEAQ